MPYSLSSSDRATELGHAVLEEGPKTENVLGILVLGQVRTSSNRGIFVPEPRATYNKLRQEIHWPI